MKLLLFLPLILGLASFKKLLGFLAIIVPGLIAFFKLCKPDLNASFGQNNYYNRPHYSQAGIGYRPQFFKDNHGYDEEYSENAYYDEGNRGLTFQEKPHYAHKLAYSGYTRYRNGESEVTAETETTSKKSILPDS